ncbi:MAG: DNA-directed RNA polymerase subunit omega [Firmicutes bacterium]|nr:DNA-directed RNA polymerase subunit omega [Bacillota bacterium]
MIFPSLSDLMKNMDSKYTLVVTVAKRARQLVDGASKLVKCNVDKPVTIAINEVYEEKITYVRTKSGVK